MNGDLSKKWSTRQVMMQIIERQTKSALIFMNLFVIVKMHKEDMNFFIKQK